MLMKHECRPVADIFFALLRSGLYGVPVPDGELPDSIDWEAVVVLARKHAVLGVIIESVRFLPEPLRPSAEMSARMGRFAMKLIQSNMGLDRRAAQLTEFFAGHGIKGVFLKGQGVARCYREPQMRHTGDIDFYVGQEQYPRAMELCKQHLVVGDNWSEESNQHFAFRWEGVMIELHRIVTEIYSPFGRKRFKRWIVDEVERSPRRRTLSVGSTAITLPPAEFDAIYIFYHALRHFVVGGIGLRQLCDWAMVFRAHGGEIDLNRLEANIKRFGLTRGWKLFGCIAVERLGVPAGQMPLYDPRFSRRAGVMLEMIMHGGSFGFHSALNATAPTYDYGVKYTFEKFRYISRYMLYTFPILPAEAVSFYLYRQCCTIKTFSNYLVRKLTGR